MACYYPAQYAPTHQPTARAARPQARDRFQPLDACIFAPGQYRLPSPPPTPAAILSGVYRPTEACIECIPRRPEFCGRPTISIPFTVHGHPAPYLNDILKDRVLLDGARDAVMADSGWSRSKWVLEWPGYDNSPRGLVVAGLTRTALAKEVAQCLAVFLHKSAMGVAPLGKHSPWSARNVNFRGIRLVALNYYHHVWVPVFAFDEIE